MRVVCASTERAALRDYASVYRLRHTSGLYGHLGAARSALRLHWNYAEQFQVEAELLVTTAMSTGEFTSFAHRLMPLPQDAGELARRNHTAATNQLVDSFAHAETTADIQSHPLGGPAATRRPAFCAFVSDMRRSIL